MHTFSGDQICALLFHRAMNAGLALLFWHAFSNMNSKVPSSSSLEVTKNGDWKTMHTRVIAADHALCYSTVSWHF